MSILTKKQWKSVLGLSLGSIRKEEDFYNSVHFLRCQVPTACSNWQVWVLKCISKPGYENIAPEGPQTQNNTFCVMMLMLIY